MGAKYLIWIEADGETIDDADEWKTFWPKPDLEYIAEEYAQYYYGYRDGWQGEWPVDFTIANESGQILGRVSVSMSIDFGGHLIKPDESV